MAHTFEQICRRFIQAQDRKFSKIEVERAITYAKIKLARDKGLTLNESNAVDWDVEVFLVPREGRNLTVSRHRIPLGKKSTKGTSTRTTVRRKR